MTDFANDLDPLFKKMSRYVALSNAQRQTLANLAERAQSVPKETAIVEQGERCASCGILAKGWAIQSKSLSDGRRQIIDILLPGTFVNLQATLLENPDFSVATLTESTVHWFDPNRLVELIRTDPVLGMAVMWDRTQEESILMERLVSLGQRSAKERLAHVLIELQQRLELRGLDGHQKLPFPVTQTTLADLLGLTAVHINRTLKDLKRDGLIDYGRNTIVLQDVNRLLRWADFDASYLHNAAMLERTRKTLSAAQRPGA